MSGENWIRVAMSDDSLVADALLRLRHAEPPPPPNKSDMSPLKLKWSVRQRRSKKGDQTRASPTTPLSWSGATSLSGGATTVEGLEESSAAVKPSETFRSKVCPIISWFFRFENSDGRSYYRSSSFLADHVGACVVGFSGDSYQMWRSVQYASIDLVPPWSKLVVAACLLAFLSFTLVELREDEIILLKERKDLKNDLASMRDLVEQQRARNNALKKMKAESQSALSCKLAFEQGSSFLLPDLNMPLDTDPSTEVLC
ncbi:unnamed protein product [Arabis nemorensis]|uniref:Uncharacterized protein n=1 Tax=Arabis nemorensis TaxID=586526 RepID=A0A565B2S5_9BRAS|nr:unnamed protein product [Arabis nemorensis]